VSFCFVVAAELTATAAAATAAVTAADWRLAYTTMMLCGRGIVMYSSRFTDSF